MGKIRTKTMKEEVLAVIARLDRRGYTQFEIAQELRRMGLVDLSQPMVSKHLKQIREDYAEAKVAERHALVIEKLDQLREVRAEAWRAYDRSMLDARRRVTERAPRLKDDEEEPRQAKRKKPGVKSLDDDLRRIKVIITREGRLPANEYLTTILKTIEMEMKLLGLLEDKTTVNNTVLINWRSLEAEVEHRVEVESAAMRAIEVKARPSSNGDRDG